ncbi:Calcium-transporting ATPase 1 [Golovinomyces cichoracearum]|uniref:Uroporphyrinogen decarboxylase n=1 Tax=Golovinomyces cichoracearum TaxID=62708 RepID=A0A420IBH7_9PEZI|nr:Calcium-transporting ATPase 1 [Golovinomyces cichoracearum]
MPWPQVSSFVNTRSNQRGNLLPLTNVEESSTAPTETRTIRSADRRESKNRYARQSSSFSKTPAEKYALLTPAETAEYLKTSLTHGLSPAEAVTRLHDQGPNELPHEDPDPLWLRFLKQFKEPLIILLLCSAGASLLVGNRDDALSIAVAVTIVITVGFIQEYRSEKSIEALNHLVPNHVNLIREEQIRKSSTQSSSIRPHTTKKDAAREALQDLGTGSDSTTTIEVTPSKALASQLVPGDLVLFSTGDRIPADIRVTKAIDLTIDESNLTGENEPTKLTAKSKNPRFASIRSRTNTFQPQSSSLSLNSGMDTDIDTESNGLTNIAFMGTLVRSGHGQGIVYATGGDTIFGRIAAAVTETESPRTPLQLSMDSLGSHLSQISSAIIAIISLIGWLQGKGLLELFTVSISLAVAAIPEGLPIIVTVTLALGVHRMAKQNAIVRKMPSVETLGSVNVVCSDKTGTLTMNHMSATKLWHFDLDVPITLDSADDANEATPDIVILRILRIGNIANNAHLTRQYSSPPSASSVAILSSTAKQSRGENSLRSRWVGQPTDVAMLDLLDRFKEHDAREGFGLRIGEIPFSSERKWMGATVRDVNSEGVSSFKEVAYIKGAIEQVLSRCETYLAKDGRELALDTNRRKEALKAAERLAEEGLRVIGFASGPVSKHPKSNIYKTSQIDTHSKLRLHNHVSHNENLYSGLTFAGIVGMSDPPRSGVRKAIKRLQRSGVRVMMITGDAETTALAIGKKLGMFIPSTQNCSSYSANINSVLTGDKINEMNDEELKEAMAHTSIFARTCPDQKMRIVGALQARGDIVAMTGDGVNDAPALKKADIGISMGLQGTDVAKEAADMILTDDDFSTILRAIEEGKAIFNNIQNFLTFQLSTSAAALSLVFFCTSFGFKNPLNAMQILWINIIMDGPPAQSLGVEPVDPDVMLRPPRKREAPVLTWSLVNRVLASASIIMLGTMAVYTHEMLTDRQITKRDTTMTFTCFVLFDMFNALNCRSESKSILRGEVGLFSNSLFNWAPIERFDGLIDAAIIFSDILVIPQAMGMTVEMLPAKGPHFPAPLSSPDDSQYLEVLSKDVDVSSELSYVFKAITMTRQKLKGRVPLIGFCGAPWTLFCYMVEGGGSKMFIQVKTWIYRYPDATKMLLQKIAEICVEYLALQVQAGAQLVQVFDSWASELSPSSFKQFSLPYLEYISRNLPKRIAELDEEIVPMTVFAKGAWYALDSLCNLGYQVVGLDWLQDPADAVRIRGSRPIVFQGNADPGILYGSHKEITSAVQSMIKGFGGGKFGWIANLGHGITPRVNPDDLKYFFEEIHRLTKDNSENKKTIHE